MPLIIAPRSRGLAISAELAHSGLVPARLDDDGQRGPWTNLLGAQTLTAVRSLAIAYGTLYDRPVLAMNQPLTGPRQLKTCHLGTPADVLDMLEWQIGDLAATDRHQVRVTNYKTMQCAVTAWQLTDWTFASLPTPFLEQWQLHFSKQRADTSLAGFQNWARSQCAALKICHAIANAFKHRTLCHDREPSITSDTMIHLDEYFRLLPQLVLTLDGFVLPPVDVIREAHTFWAERLRQTGLLVRSDAALRLKGLEADPGGWGLADPTFDPSSGR